jgi:hypothetical protein
MGLSRWYTNITITILDIIHPPVFYLKLNSALQVCPYLTGKKLRLRYEPSRLMLSVGLWRWYINITITIRDIIHHSIFYLKHDISETGFCPRLQVEPTQLVLIEWASLSAETGKGLPVALLIFCEVPQVSALMFTFRAYPRTSTIITQRTRSFSFVTQSLDSAQWASRIWIVSSNLWPPLWSSGQSSWLQIRRPGFNSRHYQKKK